nr:hypothetical protein [Tanacetum cinerariifolium]
MTVGESSGSNVTIYGLDAGNPLHVQNNNNSSSVVIPFKLLGTENYKIWSESYATYDVLSAQWDRCNAMALNWIINVVSQDVYMGLVYYENVVIVWKELKKLMIRSFLLTRDPLPEVKDAYNVVSKEKSYRGVPESSGGTESKMNSTYFTAKAKQTREPFPLSDHKSKTLGELVHLDLWGLYRVPSREVHLKSLEVDCMGTTLLTEQLQNENLRPDYIANVFWYGSDGYAYPVLEWIGWVRLPSVGMDRMGMPTQYWNGSDGVLVWIGWVRLPSIGMDRMGTPTQCWNGSDGQTLPKLKLHCVLPQKIAFCLQEDLAFYLQEDLVFCL